MLLAVFGLEQPISLLFLLASTQSENGKEYLFSQQMCKKSKTVTHTQCQCTANQSIFFVWSHNVIRYSSSQQGQGGNFIYFQPAGL